MRVRLALGLVVAMLASACSQSLDVSTPDVAPLDTTAVEPGDATPVPPTPVPPTPVPPTPVPPTPGPTPVPPTPVPPTPEPVPQLSFDDAIRLSQLDIEAYWERRLPEVYGISFEPVAAFDGYFPSDPTTLPSCGGVVAPVVEYEENAFYCPFDDAISWDNEVLFPSLYSTYGDFAVALVLAHEYGHAIQERARELGPTIIIELQADCLAGAWAGSLARDESDNLVLVDDDLQEAIGGYLVFRDPLGTPAEDPSAHGSGFDRITAFFDGFNNDAEACVDYDDDPPPIADIDLTPEDLDTGGDLELEILQPLVVEELESYWTPLLEASFDVTYVAPTLQPYGPDTELPACGGEVLDVELYRESAFFCTADNALMWDDEVLVTVLWTEVGDGASMYVLVNISAQSALVQADFASDAADFSLLAECLTGSFFADLFLGNLDELFISAGDLDELLIGVSRYTPALPDANGRSIEGIAERIGAIRRGFDNGFSTCVGG